MGNKDTSSISLKSLIDDLRDPKTPEMQKIYKDECDEKDENAESNVKDSLERYDEYDADDFVEELCFTHYYKENDGKPDYVLLFETPGKNLPNREWANPRMVIDWVNDENDKKLIDIYRDYGFSWLTEGKSQFLKSFLGALNAKIDDPKLEKLGHKLSGLSDETWDFSFSKDKFFENFMMTDAVKYRIPGSDVKVGAIEDSYELFLQREIEYVKPNLIFCFGKKAWESLRRNMSVERIGSHLNENESYEDRDLPTKITDAHGHLFEINEGGFEEKIFIIPLAHPTRFTQYLRDSYIKYLKCGLKKYIQEKNGDDD